MYVMTTEQFDREASYRAALAIVKDWQRKKLITEKEYARIDTMFARKFSPIWGAIAVVKGAKTPEIT